MLDNQQPNSKQPPKRLFCLPLLKGRKIESTPITASSKGMVVRRQPLRETAAGMRVRTNRVEDLKRRQRRSQSVAKKTGIENEAITSNNNKKRTPTKSKSESSKSRVKVLLGGMFGSSKRSSSNSVRALQLDESRAATTTGTTNQTRNSVQQQPPTQQPIPQQQQQQQQEPSLQLQLLEPSKAVDDKVHDGSQTTVLTEMEIPHSEESEALEEVTVRFLEHEEAEKPVEEEEVEEEENIADKQQKAATLFQAVFRGYQQRYEIQMMRLRQRLQQIQHNKERQLTKLEERTKTHKRRARSVLDFHDPNEKIGRQLQRVARIIPCLFREAQSLVNDYAQLVTSLQQLEELQDSHRNLQKLAHSYLESLEDVPGIWEALKAQWMSPRLPRPRRSFGPDGKIIKHVRYLNTHDDDLPVETQDFPPSIARAACDLENEHSNLFVNLFIQATASEIYSTPDDIDQAVSEFHNMVGNTVWN